ncbi:hypothetical protein H0H81_001587 [Sphagnurus paluster]|uniref:Uncharacterized protein n=1 Tax=Sphagnurus paluster TaxID=117069 RepID=A0A9P7K808_9AGAR|nr:hypothetical protein H0H81_001587 [Sphagnurus paluster]
MTHANESKRQRYSSDLAAYTLKQFSIARNTLDKHKAAAAKLPAINSYDYRIPKAVSSESSSSRGSESPDNHDDANDDTKNSDNESRR